jgi:hypothetical protein
MTDPLPCISPSQYIPRPTVFPSGLINNLLVLVRLLLNYESERSDKLKLSATGSEGLDELKDKLEEDQASFVYARIVKPNPTSLIPSDLARSTNLAFFFLLPSSPTDLRKR